jgi:hypothetical protein
VRPKTLHRTQTRRGDLGEQLRQVGDAQAEVLGEALPGRV